MRMRKPLLAALSLSSTLPHRFVRASNFASQQPLHIPPATPHSQAIRFSGNMTKGPVIALSHGGGPLPVLGDPAHENIVQSLKERVPKLLKLGTENAPRAILLITAHWSERKPTISSGAKHRLEFDYYGFPPESYELKYDAPGAPEIAKEVASAMKNEGLEPNLDDFRGWDHGVFIPMLLINPEANVPIVQISVLDSESPEEHFKMGQALRKLRESNIAIIGSGFATFHNLRIMFSGASRQPAFKQRNIDWSKAVWDGIKDADEAHRLEKLKGWREWPNAYEMHPPRGAEHFLPLVVCAGAGGPGEAAHYTDEFMGLDMYSYYWEN